MKIGNIELKNNIIIAPLAGYTDRSYRKICKESGAALVFSEMISAKGLLYENDKTWDLTKTTDVEHPIALQLFGGDASDLAKSAKMICERCDVDIIDINMGCPVKKVLKSNSGSALLASPKKVYEIVKSVVSVTDKPVSVKIRAGLDKENINCVEIAKMCEAAGAKMITIHGRTKNDFFKGSVNLDYIKMVKEAVKIPVIGNGDIKSVDDAIKMFEYTGCDGIMIGRATLGNPWLIRDLVDYFTLGKINKAPSNIEKLEMLKHHFDEMLKYKEEKVAVLEMRSLASHYVKGFKNAKELKIKLVNIKTKEDLYDLINSQIEFESLK